MESAVIDSSADFDFSELNSEAFKNMMNSAVNDDVGLDETHKVDNIQARYVLETVVGESENQDVEILKGKQNLYFRNKKTGRGYFIHFD